MELTLRDLRVQNGKSAVEVAKALNVAPRTISHYECGTRRIKLEQILVLSSLYDESAEDIIRAQINSCRQDRQGSRQRHRKAYKV